MGYVKPRQEVYGQKALWLSVLAATTSVENRIAAKGQTVLPTNIPLIGYEASCCSRVLTHHTTNAMRALEFRIPYHS